MMRDALPDRRRRLRAPDIEPSVKLNGIEIDDLAALRFGQADCEFGLAGAGGTGDDHEHARSLTTSGASWSCACAHLLGRERCADARGNRWRRPEWRSCRFCS